MAWNKANPKELAIAGLNSLHFINIDEHASASDMTQAADCDNVSMGCVAYGENGTCYAGSEDGEIFAFVKKAVEKKVKRHEGEICAIVVGADKVITGGRDELIQISGLDLTLIETIKTEEACVKALDLHPVSQAILAGFENNVISIYEKKASESYSGKILLQGHGFGGITSIAQANKMLYTCGEDGKILIWNPVRTNA